jgi:hypothetical protein
MRDFPHTGGGWRAQNRRMIAPRAPTFTLTLLKRRDGDAASGHWEIHCEGESLGEFGSLNEALATARTMAANWLGEAETVRLTGGDLSAVFIDESYSRLVQREESVRPANDPA